MMLGWFNAATACASRRKRRIADSESTICGCSTLIATSWFRSGLRAWYTSAIPPRPSKRLISYLPSFWPGDRYEKDGVGKFDMRPYLYERLLELAGAGVMDWSG